MVDVGHVGVDIVVALGLGFAFALEVEGIGVVVLHHVGLFAFSFSLLTLHGHSVGVAPVVLHVVKPSTFSSTKTFRFSFPFWTVSVGTVLGHVLMAATNKASSGSR